MGIEKCQIEVNALRITRGAYFLVGESHWAFGVPFWVPSSPSGPPTSTSVCLRGAGSDAGTGSDAGVLEYSGKPSVACGGNAFTLVAEEFASSGSWGPTAVVEELPAIGESKYPPRYGFDGATYG